MRRDLRPQNWWRGDKPATLCFFCRNSCGGCSWSSRFVPVPGWDADETIIENSGEITHSFHVKSCPEYVPDRIGKEHEAAEKEPGKAPPKNLPPVRWKGILSYYNARRYAPTLEQREVYNERRRKAAKGGKQE